MNASLENCKRLFKLSGWEDTDKWLIVNEFGESSPINSKAIHNKSYPAYTAGYLLRKLPDRIQDDNGNYFALMGFPNGINPWFAYKGGLDGKDARWPIDRGIPFYKRVFQADTPEDALCLLSIRLIEEGVLKP